MSNTGPPYPKHYGNTTVGAAHRRMAFKLGEFDKAFTPATATERPS